MGGCATKLKVLKGDEDFAPVPAPAPETVKEGYEAKAIVNEEGVRLSTHEEGLKIQGGNEEKVKAEGGDGELQGDAVKVDDMGDKPRSLSNLFKGEQEDESSGNGETAKTVVVPLEPVQQEEGSSLPEAEETATMPVAEVESTIPVVTASERVIEEIPVITAATDIQKEKTENEEKRREEKEVDAKDVEVTEQAANDDNRQEKPALPASSEPEVAEEVTGSK